VYGENLSVSHWLERNRLVSQTEKRTVGVYPDMANKARILLPLWQSFLFHANPLRKRVSSVISAQSGLGKNKFLWQPILRKNTCFGSVAKSKATHHTFCTEGNERWQKKKMLYD